MLLQNDCTIDATIWKTNSCWSFFVPMSKFPIKNNVNFPRDKTETRDIATSSSKWTQKNVVIVTKKCHKEHFLYVCMCVCNSSCVLGGNRNILFSGNVIITSLNELFSEWWVIKVIYFKQEMSRLFFTSSF